MSRFFDQLNELAGRYPFNEAFLEALRQRVIKECSRVPVQVHKRTQAQGRLELAAKEAIVITTPEMAAVRDADRVIGLLHTQGVAPIQMVLNRVRPKMVANQEMLGVSDVTDILALPLLGLVLEDEQVITSTNRGEPLTLHGALSPAGRAYMNVARRLRGEEVALIDPTRERLGLRARLMGKIRRTTGLV